MIGRIALLALLAAPSLAQNLTGLPTCAITCALSSVAASDCAVYGVTNLTCICTSTNFQGIWIGCEEKACNATELTEAEAWGVNACMANGTPITISANVTAPVSQGNSSSSTTSQSSSSATTSGVVTTTTKAPTSSSAAPSTTPAGSAAGSSSAPATTTKPAGAAKLQIVGAGMVLALVGGLATLL